MKEAHGQRQPLRTCELTARVLERVEVVADLAHVIEWLTVVLGLVLEEIDERCLCALDL
ncbi:hypothetical protein D3C83_277670 [compost metagenome]